MGNKQPENQAATRHSVPFPAQKKAFTFSQLNTGITCIKYRDHVIQWNDRKVIYMKHVTATKILIYTKYMGYINSRNSRSGYWLSVYDFGEILKCICFAQFVVDFYLDEGENNVYVIHEDVSTSCWSVNDEKFINFYPRIVCCPSSHPSGLVFEKKKSIYYSCSDLESGKEMNTRYFSVCSYDNKTFVKCDKTVQVLSEQYFVESALNRPDDQYLHASNTWHISLLTEQEKKIAFTCLQEADTRLPLYVLQEILVYSTEKETTIWNYEPDASFRQMILDNLHCIRPP